MTPQELKNSILQLAIQGKLVEQRPEEGTASFSSLSHIKIEESEIDLPETWSADTLENIIETIPTKQSICYPLAIS